VFETDYTEPILILIHNNILVRYRNAIFKKAFAKFCRYLQSSRKLNKSRIEENVPDDPIVFLVTGGLGWSRQDHSVSRHSQPTN
jgi:hypothetical protein